MVTKRQGEKVRSHSGFLPVHMYGNVMPAPLDGEIGCINGRRYVVRG